MELLQSDGSTVTLFSNSVVSGSATVSIPPNAAQTSLSNGGLTLEAGPEPLGSPASGGASGLSGLINALESLAGTANGIVNVLDSIASQGVLWSAGSITDAAFSSSVQVSLDSAASDLSGFVSTLGATFDSYGSEIYEMSEAAQGRIFPSYPGAVEEFDLLQSLRKLVSGITGLRNDVIKGVQAYWLQGTASAAALAAAEEALRNFGSFDWAAEKPVTSSTSTASNSTSSTVSASRSSSSTSSSTATPTPYFFDTHNGTDLSTFQAFIKTLPDAGQGDQSIVTGVPWQGYSTNLTAEQAQAVANQSFVSYVIPNLEGDDSEQGSVIPLEHFLSKRAPSDINLNERHLSDNHLRIISAQNQRNGQPASTLPNYLFDPSLGQGSTIYIIDTGANPYHIELLSGPNRNVEQLVVPNEFTLRPIPHTGGLPHLWAPEDITDYHGHGTLVASVAAGTTHGVASKANLVIVKFRNAAQNPLQPGPLLIRNATPAALSHAWKMIIGDILSKRANGATGRFVVNLSYGFEIDTPRINQMQDILTSAFQNDVVFVVCAMNRPTPQYIDERVPQAMGTAGNQLITVGGVLGTGVFDPRTSQDRGRGGSITVYAQSNQVNVADYTTLTESTLVDGTSVAAPAVAGLAAYFFALPSLASRWTPGNVAMDMKNYITK